MFGSADRYASHLCIANLDNGSGACYLAIAVKWVKKFTMLLVGLSVLGCKGNTFQFQVLLANSGGLRGGSEVRYLGPRVGKVERVLVENPKAGGPPEVAVTVRLTDKRITIRREDKFCVATAGLLGEEYLEVVPGPSSSPPVPEGASLWGKASPSVTDASTVGGALGLAAKLGSLPKEKKARLIKTSNHLLDKALEEQRERPGTTEKGGTSKH